MNLLAAPGAASEKPPLDPMREIDNQYCEPTRDRIEPIAQQIKGILNDEQLAVLTQRFGTHDW